MEANLGGPPEAHRRLLEHRLRSLPGLESFDRAMERLAEGAPEASERHLRGIAPVFERVVPSFSRRDALGRAYVAVLARRWYRAQPAAPVVMDALMEGVHFEALYTRQNAFEAIVALGAPDDVARAVAALGETDSAHGRRLVSEALLAYPGAASSSCSCARRTAASPTRSTWA